MYLGYVTTRYNYKLVRSASDMHGCDGWHTVFRGLDWTGLD